MANLTLTTSINIKAPMAKVWHALTDKETIKKYFFGTEADSTWEVGSPITFSGEWEGKAYQDKGTILEKTDGKFLKYNYWSSMAGTEDKPENYANITYSLSEQHGETVFTLTQDNVKDQAALEHSKGNWQYLLNAMKELLEN